MVAVEGCGVCGELWAGDVGLGCGNPYDVRANEYEVD